MRSLSFYAAHALGVHTIGQCADLVRNGPLPRSDVLEIILLFEELLVLAEQSHATMSDAAYASLVLKTLMHFAMSLNACEHVAATKTLYASPPMSSQHAG